MDTRQRFCAGGFLFCQSVTRLRVNFSVLFLFLDLLPRCERPSPRMKTEIQIRWESLKVRDLMERYGVHKIQVYRWIQDGRMRPEIKRDECGEYMAVTKQTLIDFDALGGRWKGNVSGKTWSPNKRGGQTEISTMPPIGDSEAVGILAESIADPTPDKARLLGEWMLETIRKSIQREIRACMKREVEP